MIRNSLVVVLVTLVSSAPALAAPAYTASLAAPAGVERVVSSDRLWSCSGATCLAGGEATSPARHICSRIAKEVGALTAFAAQGRAFSVEEVAACNARAGHTQLPAAAN